MSPATPFPLLDLPSIAFQGVVSFWSIMEQNNLSKVSKKCKQRLLSEYLPRHISFYTKDMSDEQFIELISLMNSMRNSKSLKVSMCLNRKQDVVNFMKFFKKPTKALCIFVKEDFSIPENLKFEYSQSDEIYIFWAHWVGLKELFAFDFKTAKFGGSRLKSYELNTFLKSWKEGKTNKRMEECEFGTMQPKQMYEVFGGLSPMFENPKDINGTKGEVKIQRDDGKIAVVKIKLVDNFSSFFSRTN